MSYSFELLFLEQEIPTEGDALKCAMDMAKRLASDPALAKEQIASFSLLIKKRLRMAGAKWWNGGVERDAFMRTEAARLAIETAIDSMFSLRFVYWPQHRLMAHVGGAISPQAREGMHDVFFQNSCDQDYEYSDWPDAIPFFKQEKERVLATPDAKLVAGYPDFDGEDVGYIRRTYLYDQIFKGLALNDWLWRTEEENGFVNIRVNGVVSSDIRVRLNAMLREYIIKHMPCVG